MNFIAVFLGGGFGAVVRYLLSLIMPRFAYIPISTLTANFFGCFIGTVVFVYFADKINIAPEYKLFLITGFCGGLSTLSALSLELLKFIQAGEYYRAVVYALVTTIICTLSVILGVLLVKNTIKI